MTAPAPSFSALKNARVMVTGGFGLIGSTLARQLVRIGADVLLVDSLKEDFGGRRLNIHEIRYLLRTNISDIRDTMDSAIYCATAMCSSIWLGRPVILILCVRHLKTLKLIALRNFRSWRPVATSIQRSVCSTRARDRFTDGPATCPLMRNTRSVPWTSTASTRLPVNPITDCTSMRMASRRPFYALQTPMDRTCASRIYARRFLACGCGACSRLILLKSGRSAAGGFAFAEDVAWAFLLAAVTPQTKGKVYNVGGSDVITLTELANMLIEINGGGNFEIKEFPLDRKVIDIGDYYSDDRAFRSATGWSPQVAVKDGLRRTLDFYRANLCHYI